MAQETKPTYRIHTGDSLAVLPTLPEKSVDLVVTDPPFFRVKNEAWDRQWNQRDEFLAWLEKIVIELARVLKPNGSLYLFASSKLASHVEVTLEKHLRVLNRVHWAKPQYSTKAEMFRKEDLRSYFPASEAIIFAEPYARDYQDADRVCHRKVYSVVGDYIRQERERAGVGRREVEVGLGYTATGNPNQGTGLCYRWEEGSSLPSRDAYDRLRIFLNSRHSGHERYLCQSYEDLRQSYEDLRQSYEDLRQSYEDLRRPFHASEDRPYTDTWDFKTVGHYKGKHVCEKPQDLLRHAILTSSRAGAVVLDAFAGSGSTGEAALALGRSFIGIELDPSWAAKSAARCEAVLRGHQGPA